MSDAGSVNPSELFDPNTPEGRTLLKWRAYNLKHPEVSVHTRFDKLLQILAEEAFGRGCRKVRDIALSMHFESDRGCVLVAATVIDHELEELFRDVFRANSDASKEEMDFLLTRRPIPPLQSTAIKIRLAAALGLISREWAAGLAALQDLRSTVAAHSRDIMEITIDHVAAIGKKLPKSARDFIKTEPLSQEFIQESCRGPKPVSPPRALFVMLVFLILEMIEDVRKNVQSERRVVEESGLPSTDKDGEPGLGGEQVPDLA